MCEHHGLGMTWNFQTPLPLKTLEASNTTTKPLICLVLTGNNENTTPKITFIDALRELH